MRDPNAAALGREHPERAGGQGFAHNLRPQDLDLLGGVGGGIHGGLERLVEGGCEAPEVHGDPRVGGERGRFPAVAGHEAPLGGPGHLAPLVHADQRAVVADAGDAPGDGGGADDGVVEAVAHERVGVGVWPWRWVASCAEAAWP